MADGRFVSTADVENFLGPDKVRRIYDDDEDGAPDDDPVLLLIQECETEVFGAAVGTYPADNLPSTPAEAKTTEGGKLLRSLTLKLVRACAWERYPEIARVDPEPIRKEAEKMLDRLCRAKLVLHGLGAKPANIGGEVIADDVNLEDEPKKFFTTDGQTGIF